MTKVIQYGRWRTQKLEPSDIPLIQQLAKEGIKVTDIAEKFEVTKQTIYRVLNGETWTAYGVEE